jgi:ligand-binding sensor domain-containing protein/signal transduction histidine kinase
MMRSLLAILFCLLTTSVLSGQDEVFHYPDDHPLSTGYVQSLLQDQSGFLWIGGQTSLRRFDGESTRSFAYERGDSTSLLGNYVWSLYESPEEVLWVGTSQGLSRYLPEREAFKNYAVPVLPGADTNRAQTVLSIREINPGQLWVGTNYGLHRFDVAQESFARSDWLPPVDAPNFPGAVTDIQSAPNGDLIIASETGLFQIALDGDVPVLSSLPEENMDAPRKMAFLKDGRMLAGAKNGLFIYRWNGEAINREGMLHFGDTAATATNFVTDLTVVNDDLVFVASAQGLHRVSISSDGVLVHETTLNHDPDNGKTLSSDQLSALYLSHDGTLLVGTRQGLDRTLPGSPSVQIIRRQPGRIDLCSNNAKGSAYDPKHEILVVGTQEGITTINVSSGEVRCFSPDNLPGLRTAYIINLEPGPRPHTFWICYRRGGVDLLSLENPEAPKIEPIIYPPGNTTGTSAYQVVVDSANVFWMATAQGLFGYDSETGKRFIHGVATENRPGLTDKYVFSVLYDRKFRLWAGTNAGGLCRKIVQGDSVSFISWRHDPDDPNSLPSDMILHLYEDRRGNIWVSTPKGLAVFQDGEVLRTFTEEDGLPYTFCYGVFEDENDQLWLVLGGEILQIFLDEEGLFTVGNRFNRFDGLASGYNAQYGWTSLPDGRVALSSPHGLSVFHPDSLQDAQRFSGLLLTDFRLFNESVPLRPDSTKAFTLPAHISTLEEVNLPPGQNFISFHFSTPNFRPGMTPRYSYRLSSIQDDWTELGQEGQLSFAQLPPGNYALDLRSGFADGTWNPEFRRLHLHLAAPWYQRTWAYSLYLMLLIALIGGVFQFRERQRNALVAARQEERENFRRRSARDFHDEAGNHLSRISLLTAVARQQLNQEGLDHGARTQVQSFLADIDGNLQVVREGMRDFIWALDPDNDHALELCQRLKRFAQELFQHHPARLEVVDFPASLADVPLSSEKRRHLILLFKEAMHNSCKHAPNANLVKFSVHHDQQNLIMIWADKGPGFNPTEGGGNGLKNMGVRAQKIGAQLSLRSDHGTQIRLTLPLISPR